MEGGFEAYRQLSSIFDAGSGIEPNGKFFIQARELVRQRMGLRCRAGDLVKLMIKKGI